MNIQNLDTFDRSHYKSATSEPLAKLAETNARRQEPSKCQQCKDKLEKSLQELADIKYALDRAAIIAIADPRGTIEYANDKFCKISGYDRNELVGQNYRLLNSGYHPPEFFGRLWSTISAGKVWQGEIRDRAKNGSIYWVNTTIVPFLDDRNKPWQYLSIQFDISDRKEIEEALIESQTQYQTLVNLSPVGIFRTDRQGLYLDVNERWCKLAGMTAQEALGDGWARTIHRDDRPQVLAEWYRATDKNLPFKSAEYRLQRTDELTTWVFAQAVAQTAADGTILGYVGTITDITERKQAEEKLRYHAWHDPLTGLANRALFLQRLERVLQQSQQFQQLFAVLFLDLNRFKVINDSLGHLVGDRLLSAVARRLQSCLQAGDTVARLGGDEFTIVLEDVRDLNDVMQVANRIQKELEQPFYLNEQQIFTGASIGIVLCGSQERAAPESINSDDDSFPNCPLPNPITFHEKPEDILRAADTAMYHAKELGGIARYVVFNPRMYQNALALLQLENDLRRAVETCDEFILHYQPIFSPETDRITGFEALVRWQHPTRGLVSPNEFIPLAEETGLIIPLGYCIFAQAVRQLQIWQSTFPEDSLTMSINLSPKQFAHPDLVETIDEMLGKTGLDGTSLNLEITESTLMDNPEAATKMLAELRKRGIQLSIDDFGTGYSSLAHLIRFPLNTLKIDRSFIKQMGERGENSSMVWTIVTLAHNLGMDVVAEGVETGFQLAQLKKLQCEKVQGYFFSNPLEIEAATALLAASSVNLGALDSRDNEKKHQSDTIPQKSTRGKRTIMQLTQREKLLKRRLASQIRNSLDFNTILKTATNEIRQLMQIDCCQFLWYRDDISQPQFEPIRNTCQLETVCPGCLKPETPVIDVLRDALLKNQRACIDDANRDPHLNPAQRNYLLSRGVQSLLAVTVHPSSGKVGVIVCESHDRQRSWDKEDIDLLDDMAAQLALAIDHAQLYEESRFAAAIAKSRATQMQKALTDLQETQTQLIQSEKMSSLGLLVAGVAHEINNPISFITGNINHAREYANDLLELLCRYQDYYPQPPAEIRELSQAIDLDFLRDDLANVMASMEVGASRIQEIVKSLRTFSRLDEAEMKPVDIHEGIESTLLILQNRFKPNPDNPGIEIIKDYDTLPRVACYAGQLNQVFMNILCNAMDALDSYDRGRSPSVASARSHPSQIVIRTETTPRDTVTVSIRDNGPGMGETVKKRLFDPFFTTKPVGKGTGLGLSISYQIIVDKHRGKIDCISVLGEGTEFIIEIPIRQQAFPSFSAIEQLRSADCMSCSQLHNCNVAQQECDRVPVAATVS